MADELINSLTNCFQIAGFSYLSCFGFQGQLLLNNLLFQAADHRFEDFNLGFVLAVRAKLCYGVKDEEKTLSTLRYQVHVIYLTFGSSVK